MKRSSLALLTSLFLAPLAAYAQSVARVGQLSRRPDEIENEGSEEVKLASRSMFHSASSRRTVNWLECRTRLSEMI